MTKKRWIIEYKAIVMESLTTSTSTVDISKKYGLSPNTFYPWRGKFLEGGKAALAGSHGARTVRAVQKESATLKTLVGEITLPNDLLKKPWRRGKNVIVQACSSTGCLGTGL